MNDTSDRQKVVDFVNYFKVGPVVLVKAGNPGKGLARELCGQSVSVETGTTEP